MPVFRTKWLVEAPRAFKRLLAGCYNGPKEVVGESPKENEENVMGSYRKEDSSEVVEENLVTLLLWEHEKKMHF